MTSDEREHDPGASFVLALAGDVMTGRGVDQLLPRPSSPELYEDYLRDARDYVDLAERQSGPIPRPVGFEYPWGDALEELRRADVRVINLETSVTTSDEPWPGKGIHYRMHPGNVGCVVSAGIDVAVLANNHVLDWGRAGLVETLETLHGEGLRTAGAGLRADEADAVAIAEVDGGRRVLVAAVAEPSAGVPPAWAATAEQPGISLVRRLDEQAADTLADRLRRVRRAGDVAVVSIHWGSNWGYEVEAAHVEFAHALVERGVDVLFGHSSHHPRPIEIVRDKPVLYGAGDLVNDYEGITSYGSYRNDLVLLYTLHVGPPERGGGPGAIEVRMRPFRICKMRLEHAPVADARWLQQVLARESRRLGTDVLMREDGLLEARARRDGG